jgi:fibronectin type 3 domain-containing protein
LTPDTTYYFSVKEVNGSGYNGPASTPVSANAGAAVSLPATPTGVSATAVSSSVITISWNTVYGASGYNIYRSTSSTSGYIKVNTTAITGTPYTNTGLTAVTTYYYKITAVNGGGESPQSTSANAATQAALMQAPQNLSASNTDPGSIALTWSPVSGGVLYNIYRSDSAGGAYSVIDTISLTSFTDIGLNVSTTYYYQVSAVSSGGVEGERAEISKITSNVQGPIKVPKSNISEALTWLTANGESYLVDLNTSSIIVPATLSYSGITDITITLRGTGSTRVVSLNTGNAGSLFTIPSGVTLVLDTKITLNGYITNTAPPSFHMNGKTHMCA